jgi:hypothetical protein
MPRAHSSQSNVPAAPLRWLVDRAALEFGLTPNTLRKALNKNSAQADAAGLYSTRQICDAVFGGLADEKLRTQKELTRKYALENSIMEANYLPRTELLRAFSGLADAMTSIISRSGLSREEQEDLQRELSSIPIVVAAVARHQSKLPRRSSNGQEPEEDELDEPQVTRLRRKPSAKKRAPTKCD